MKRILLFLSIILMSFHLDAQPKWELRLIPQVAFGAKNTVQQPNDAGTRVYLNDDFERTTGARFSPRLELEFNIKRHHIIATAAILNDRFEGIAKENISYNGVVFNQGTSLEAFYRFNTYRLGYRFRLVNSDYFSLDLGATLLLRDALISFEENSTKASFKNVGVAPLLSYNLEWHMGGCLSLQSYGDAFAIKAGRAIDVFAGFKYRFHPSLSIFGGYRLLEGGSDSDEVYTMATFHFATLGIGLNF